MKATNQIIGRLIMGCVLAVGLVSNLHAQAQKSPPGTYYSAKDPDLVPYPFNPHPELETVEVSPGVFVFDDTLIPDTPQQTLSRQIRRAAAERAKQIASDPVLAKAEKERQQAALEAAWAKSKEQFATTLQSAISSGDAQIETVADLEKLDLQRLGEGIPTLQEAELAQRSAITNFALQNGVDIEGVDPDGSGMLLVRFVNGLPQSYISQNSVSAQTIATDKVRTNGGFGLNLTGQGLTIGLWDEGDVLTNHIEFGTNLWRVVDKDGVTGVARHSTHVAGTLAADGKDSGAIGMSPKASIHACNFVDDLIEVPPAVTNGLKLSNHSYAYQRGWGTITLSGIAYRMWWGDTNLSQNEDYLFGFYESTAQDIDRAHYLGNSYLQVWAAGNERGPKGSPNATQPVGHYITDGFFLYPIFTVTRALDGDAGGYDSLPNQMCAKNNLSVGSVADLPGGYTNAASVLVSSFTSFGPTDDGRIKPDVAANGELLRSTVETGTTAYDNESGTSMASPSVAGSVNLLREHWFNLFGTNRQPWASTLKGLVIHTADEAGPTVGPDYQIGWGLMNTRRAALLISSNAAYATRQFIKEFSLINGNSVEYQFQATGTEPVTFTIVWTDPPGPIPPYMIDPTNRVLVNDLDLRIIAPNGTTNFPFVLNPAARTNAATTADNVRDNVEQVVITNPVTNGNYTVRVTHKGNLVNDFGTNSLQRFSLAAFGVAPGTKPTLIITNIAQTGAGQMTLQWAAVPGLNYQIQARNDLSSGSWSNVSPEINAYRANPSYTLSGQTNANRFYRLVELP